jgi:four helix bundle protein
MNGNSDAARQLDKRLLLYAVRIIGVVHALPKNMIGAHVAKQILRSGTSGGANYREACGAESRSDFIHKMQIVVKELRETDYWLSVTREAKLLPAKRLESILQETNELIAMSVSSVVTAKGRLQDAQER